MPGFDERRFDWPDRSGDPEVATSGFDREAVAGLVGSRTGAMDQVQLDAHYADDQDRPVDVDDYESEER